MVVIAKTPVAYVDERIRLGQVSTEYSDPISQRRHDIRMAFELDLDAFGLTEAGEIWEDLARVGERAGYSVFPGPGGGGFAVHQRCTVITDGFVKTIPRQAGVYGPRGPHWLQMVTPAGNLAHLVEQHWLTGTVLGPTPARREERNVALSEAFALQTAMLAKGPALGFWLGDFNVDERKDDGSDPAGPKAILREAGLVSIYDDLGRRPRKTTKFKALDWIGHVASDKRVTAVDVEVLEGFNSNHAPLVATYDIRAERRPEQPPDPEPTPCPGTIPCGLDAGHDGPHVPGGLL